MRDCVLSVMRHRQAEDLFSLHTKGFRGEALAIAAIAHVEKKTKHQEELGTQIIVEGSKFVSQDMAVLPKGTSFAVKISFQYSSTS
jgi:DNA mismatch repair protein MutL